MFGFGECLTMFGFGECLTMFRFGFGFGECLTMFGFGFGFGECLTITSSMVLPWWTLSNGRIWLGSDTPYPPAGISSDPQEAGRPLVHKQYGAAMVDIVEWSDLARLRHSLPPAGISSDPYNVGGGAPAR